MSNCEQEEKQKNPTFKSLHPLLNITFFFFFFSSFLICNNDLKRVKWRKRKKNVIGNKKKIWKIVTDLNANSKTKCVLLTEQK